MGGLDHQQGPRQSRAGAHQAVQLDIQRGQLLQGAVALLEQGHHVLFIRLLGTEAAIDNFGRRRWLEDLEARYGNALISTPVWDSYLDVVAAMAMCAVIVTDSGSIVEEANVLEVPCVTLRFGSDRSETFLAGSNFLAPPIDKDLMTSVIHNVFEHRADLSWKRVYPEGASRMLVDAVEKRLDEGSLLISEEWRYGLRAQLR